MNFNNLKSGIITVNHDIREINLNAYQNGVDQSHQSHQENEGEETVSRLMRKKERNNFTLDEKN